MRGKLEGGSEEDFPGGEFTSVGDDSSNTCDVSPGVSRLTKVLKYLSMLFRAVTNSHCNRLLRQHKFINVKIDASSSRALALAAMCSIVPDNLIGYRLVTLAGRKDTKKPACPVSER